jgi:hypothetical protein
LLPQSRLCFVAFYLPNPFSTLPVLAPLTLLTPFPTHLADPRMDPSTSSPRSHTQDLGSLQSVKDFAANFTALNLPLHFLINNAGIMGTRTLVVVGFLGFFCPFTLSLSPSHTHTHTLVSGAMEDVVEQSHKQQTNTHDVIIYFSCRARTLFLAFPLPLPHSYLPFSFFVSLFLSLPLTFIDWHRPSIELLHSCMHACFDHMMNSFTHMANTYIYAALEFLAHTLSLTGTPYGTTTEGIEQQWGTNHVGMYASWSGALVYACMYACMFARVCMYVCMYLCVCVCACMYVCMYACMCLCVFVCVNTHV